MLKIVGSRESHNGGSSELNKWKELGLCGSTVGERVRPARLACIKLIISYNFEEVQFIL